MAVAGAALAADAALLQAAGEQAAGQARPRRVAFDDETEAAADGDLRRRHRRVEVGGVLLACAAVVAGVMAGDDFGNERRRLAGRVPPGVVEDDAADFAVDSGVRGVGVAHVVGRARPAVVTEKVAAGFALRQPFAGGGAAESLDRRAGNERHAVGVRQADAGFQRVVARDNALETGVSLSHTYGMPFIPGSAVKGLCRAAAGEWLAQREARRYLFGDDRRSRAANDMSDADAADAGIDSEIGGVIFHDAWWDPAGKAPPLVAEVVTGHHPGYYGSAGKQDATDFDAPVPAPQIAVSGRFRFVIEGDPAWTRLACRLLAGGLQQRGIGGKRSSGYGHFLLTPPPPTDRA